MTITVTTHDIEEGHKFDPDNCAVARALKRAGIAHLGVMGPSVMVADSWGRVTALPLPQQARHWILEYDAGKQVPPLSFDLAPPPPPSPDELGDERLSLDRTASLPGRTLWHGANRLRPSCLTAEAPELCGRG